MKRKKEPLIHSMDFTSIHIPHYKILRSGDFKTLDTSHANSQILKVYNHFKEDLCNGGEYSVDLEGGNYLYNLQLAVKRIKIFSTGHVDFAWLGEFEETLGSGEAVHKRVDLAYLIRRPVYNNPNNDLIQKLVSFGDEHGNDTRMEEAPWGYCFKVNQDLYEPLKNLEVKPLTITHWTNKSSFSLQDD